MRLDKLDTGQSEPQFGQKGLLKRQVGLEEVLLELAKDHIRVNDRQSHLQDSLSNLMQVVKQTSLDITMMLTKQDLNNFFDAMMIRFDRTDAKMDLMQSAIDGMRKIKHLTP